MMLNFILPSLQIAYLGQSYAPSYEKLYWYIHSEPQSISLGYKLMARRDPHSKGFK